MAIRTMQHRDSPTFGKAVDLRHLIPQTCCKEYPARGERLIYLRGDVKLPLKFPDIAYRALMKRHSVVSQHLGFRAGRYLCGCAPVVSNKIMGMGRLSVAGFSSIHDEYLSKRTPEGHCCRQSGVTSSDDNHIIVRVNGGLHSCEVLMLDATVLHLRKFDITVKKKKQLLHLCPDVIIERDQFDHLPARVFPELDGKLCIEAIKVAVTGRDELHGNMRVQRQNPYFSARPCCIVCVFGCIKCRVPLEVCCKTNPR